MAALIHPARAVPGVGTKAVAGLPVASQRANGNKKKTYIDIGAYLHGGAFSYRLHRTFVSSFIS